MTITTQDLLIAAMPGQRKHWAKTPLVATSGLYGSLWTVAGGPGQGAAPTTPVVPTKATVGAFPFTNPAGAQKAYLGAHGVNGGSAHTLILYDRLSHQAGLSGTSGSAQTTNLPTAAITRPDANGEDVEIWLEWYGATGSTSVTVTASYTNQAGTAGQTTSVITLATSVPAARMYLLPLAAGDTGCRSVESVTLSATTGTAGNFGVTLLRRVDEGYVPGIGGSFSKGPLDTGMPEIYADACLAYMSISAGTNAAFAGVVGILLG